MSQKLSFRLALKKDSASVSPMLYFDLYAIGHQSNDLIWAGDQEENKYLARHVLKFIASSQGMAFQRVADRWSTNLHTWNAQHAEIEFGLLQIGEVSNETFKALAHVLFEGLTIDRMKTQHFNAYSMDVGGLLADRSSFSDGNSHPEAFYQQHQLMKRRDALMRR